MKRKKTKIKSFINRCPSPVKSFFGRFWDYSFRLSRWFHILKYVHGININDKLVLWCSAVASLFVSFKDIDKWQDPVLLGDVTVTVDGFGIFSLRSHTDDLWHVLPTRESLIVEVIKSTLKPGDVFVDAGANIGVYTVLASPLVGDSGRIIAIEMMPDTASILRRHIAQNSIQNAVVVEKAVSDVAGRKVTAFVPSGQCGQASIVGSPPKEGLEIQVKTSTLDSILVNVKGVSLMKMDLEGVEKNALTGAVHVLEKTKIVIFEDWGNGECFETFDAAGFDVNRLDGNNCVAINRAFL